MKERVIPAGDGRAGETRLLLETRVNNLTRYPIRVTVSSVKGILLVTVFECE